MTSVPTDSSRPDNRTDPILLEQTTNGTEAQFTLKVPSDLVYFENHFPGYPMLPGVVQTKWAIDLARQLPLPDSFLDNFSAMSKLKFMRLITPGAKLTLQLTASDKSLSFRYFDDEGDYSSGHLSFK